jgi:hypothetical protein
MFRSPSSTEVASASNNARRQLFNFKEQKTEPSLQEQESYILSNYILSNLNITINSTADLATAVAWIDLSRSCCSQEVYKMVMAGLSDHLKFSSEYACSLFNQLASTMVGSSLDASVVSYHEDLTETTQGQLLGEVVEGNILEE